MRPSYVFPGLCFPFSKPSLTYKICFGRMEVQSALIADSETLKVNPFGRIRAVEDRINDLQTLLSGSKFDPEKVNVQGTIDAYRSGQISYSNDYSLIWAGQIVDKAKTYAEFTTDRQERLDRYAQEYGPHWLWWEPPLWVHPDERVMAAGCQIIERTPSAGGFGQFYISQVCPVFRHRDLY